MWFLVHYLCDATQVLSFDEKVKGITKIGLQDPVAGTDDVVVHLLDANNQPRRMYVQIKSSLQLSRSSATDETFKHAWRDYHDQTIFNPILDRFIVVTTMLPKSHIDDPYLFILARHHITSAEFYHHVASRKALYSDAIEVIRDIVGLSPSPSDMERLWHFLKSIFFVTFDLNMEGESISRHTALSLMTHQLTGTPWDGLGIWTRLLMEVQRANKTAGVFNLSTLPANIVLCFKSRVAQLEQIYMAPHRPWAAAILSSEDWHWTQCKEEENIYFNNPRCLDVHLRLRADWQRTGRRYEGPSILSSSTARQLVVVPIYIGWQGSARVVETVHVVTDGMFVCFPAPEGVCRLWTFELHVKVAELFGLMIFGGSSNPLKPSQIQILPQPLLDMSAVRGVIERRELASLRHCIALAQKHGDGAWLSYIYRIEHAQAAFGVDQEHMDSWLADRNDGNVISLAMEKDWWEGVKELLNSYPRGTLNLNLYNRSGNTPLLAAVRDQSIPLPEVRLLLEHGADITLTNKAERSKHAGYSVFQLTLNFRSAITEELVHFMVEMAQLDPRALSAGNELLILSLLRRYQMLTEPDPPARDEAGLLGWVINKLTVAGMSSDGLHESWQPLLQQAREAGEAIGDIKTRVAGLESGEKEDKT